MSKKKRSRWFILGALLLFSLSCKNHQQVTSAITDPEIERLISQMSLEEKAGEMTQINLDVICEGKIYGLIEPHHIQADKLDNALLNYHVGSILNSGGHAYPVAQWKEIISEIQRVATTKTRLKIPILYGVDAIHGANYVMGSTLFPQQLSQAATFSPELTFKAAEVTAYETRAAGISWNFSPVLDVARNPNWSRYFETFGEDPLVCSRFGVATVQGYQGNARSIDNIHVAACMKHFLGYSGARTGRDRTPAYLSDIELREIYLPSFKAATEAGALSVMINSGEINGIPVHANPAILVDLLRNELHFEGVAVTDWEDVMKLHIVHQVTSNNKESVKLAVLSGIDMCMVPNDYEFTKDLIALVKEGQIPESRLNESVRRILLMKKKLGLFNDPFPPSNNAYPEFGSAAHQALALQIAEESITLLENKNSILPLSRDKKVFVTGPAAHSMTILNGAWTRTWQGVDTTFDDPSKFTILEALQMEGGKNISYSKGCELNKLLPMEESLTIANASDVIIVCLGEIPCTEKPGDIESLALPKEQREYITALQQLHKPIVLVLVENRPRIISDIADKCEAIITAYLPGDYGGEALAHILYGKVNPSGKLPFTYPRNEQSIILYDHKNSETLDNKYGLNAFNPQWPLGHGMSYSTIEYSNIQLSSDTLKGNETLNITCSITNKSSRVAKESVLLFTKDHVASVTPSAKKLRDFMKYELAAGESKEITFSLNKSQLSFINAQLKTVTEEGSFDVIIGLQKKTFYYKP